MSTIDFQTKYETTKNESIHIHQRCNVLAMMRFLLFSLMIIFLLLGYFWINGCYVLSGISLVLFVIIVKKHSDYKKQDIYIQALLQTYLKHLQRQKGEWKDFLECGDEFLEEHDYKSLDLDILGKNSLYQMICVAFTSKGKKQLAKDLILDQTYENMKKRKKAVQELANMPEFVVQLETSGLLIPHQKKNGIDHWLESLQTLSITSISPLIFILPVVICLSLLGVCFHWFMPYSQVILEIGVVFQLCLAFLFYGKHQKIFEPISYLSTGLESYAHSYAQIVNNSFASDYLKTLQQQLIKQEDVVLAIRQLSRISQKVIYRHNIFAFIVLNGLGLFDFYIHFQYAHWLKQYQEIVPEWFDVLAKFESLMSLSVLKIDQFDVVLPHIQDQKVLDFEDLRHPLIDPQQVVGNDFSMNEPLCVITGSNMSGKTTFMRSIGLNLVLAYAGGFVFAKSMTCTPMHIMTSMRIKDNVEEGVSTFYGELLRIKAMITFSQKHQPMICLIDEIFKGTNSLDRIAGAKATIEKLSLPYAYTFLTTHDLELGQLKKQNYHFDEYYQDEHICFDYKIKKGISQSSNGQFLLKQVGIID